MRIKQWGGLEHIKAAPFVYAPPESWELEPIFYPTYCEYHGCAARPGHGVSVGFEARL
jgi:hypothetical protein